ncbi:MAG: hypothetical protein JRK53_03360 [Deltaproteobacteria bacterium]|nr:hypothetical protein [Deltaproteobacteria bacterium]
MYRDTRRRIEKWYLEERAVVEEARGRAARAKEEAWAAGADSVRGA